jgi:Lipin/Ned1/Smp2 multi-domain protein middle domain
MLVNFLTHTTRTLALPSFGQSTHIKHVCTVVMISQYVQGYISNENLLVLIGEQLYTLQQALPHILSIAAFGRALPSNNCNRVYTASSSTDNLAADDYVSDNTDNTEGAAASTISAPTAIDTSTADNNNTDSDTTESKQQQLKDIDADCVTSSGSVDAKHDARSTTDTSECDNSNIPPKPSTPMVSSTTDVTASPALSWSGWLLDNLSYSNNSVKASSDTSNSSKLLERKRSKSKMSTAVRQVRTLRPTSEQLQVSLNQTYFVFAICMYSAYFAKKAI